MGQDLARLSNECDCWVSEDEPHQGVPMQAAMVDPVANLVTNDIPKSSLLPKREEPPAAPIAPAFYNIAAWAEDGEETGFVIPPPPPEAPSPPAKADPLPAAAPVAPTPKPAPAPAPAAPKPVAKKEPRAAPKQSPGGQGFSIDAVLADLEGAEQAAFTAAFKSLSSGLEVLPADHEQLKSFILINSGVTEQDLEVEMLKLASARDDFSIDAHALISLLREFPISDNDALNLFMNLSSDGEGMSSEECRTCLMQLTNRLPETGLSQERLDRIYDRVMTSAGLSVSMEEWIQFAKTAARILRLIAYTKA